MFFGYGLFAAERKDYKECDNEAVDSGSLCKSTAQKESCSYIALSLRLTSDGLGSLSCGKTYTYTCACACKNGNTKIGRASCRERVFRAV